MKPRKEAWMRDELILALDLYFEDGKKARKASCEALSEILRSIPIEPESFENPKFRGWESVYAKLQNFVAIDDSVPRQGYGNGNRLDRVVWKEFDDEPARLHRVAAAIKANLATMTRQDAEVEEGDLEEALEGRLLTRTHRIRERNKKLVRAKKRRALKESGRLACEGCDFDFRERYGERGEDFIECHHIVPVSTLKPGERTKIDDFVLLCSNCHRMVHVRQPWLELDELIAIQSGR